MSETTETPTGTENKPIEMKQEKKALPAEIPADERGLVVGRTLEEQYRIARYYCQSKLVPAAYDTPEKVFVAMQFCAENGLKPLTSMRQIAVINGVPSPFGELPLAIVRASGKLKKFREWHFDAQYREISRENSNLNAEVFGAECYSERWNERGEFEAISRRFTVQDAKDAGLWGTKVWKPYPKRMLQMRSRSWNLKDNFGDILSGMSIAEYDHNALPGEIEVQSEVAGEAPRTDKAAELRARLRGEPIESDPVDVQPVAAETPAAPEQPPVDVVSEEFLNADVKLE